MPVKTFAPQEVIDLAAVLNALRVTIPPRRLSVAFSLRTNPMSGDDSFQSKAFFARPLGIVHKAGMQCDQQ
jgi:hypothetical protein